MILSILEGPFGMGIEPKGLTFTQAFWVISGWILAFLGEGYPFDIVPFNLGFLIFLLIRFK